MRLVLLIFCALFALSCATPITPILKHTWATGILDFTFPTQADRDYYIAHKLYLLCVPNGIKMAPNGDIFVSIRRMGNCPVTFARLLPNFQLEPYPSWEANGGVPNAEQDPAPWRDSADNLQSVLGFEIDSCNRLWILDQGVSVTYPAQPGGAKLMVYDLNNNNLLRTHKFSENVVLPTNSFLDDLVVDLKHNFVYITDAGVPSGAKPAGGVFSNNTRGALIIYDVVKDDSWRVLDSHFSVQPDPYPFWPVAAGERLSNKVDRVNVGADGAGLNPDATLFYYTSLTSQRLFRIPTITLRESRGLQVPEIAGNVTLVVKDTGSIAGGIVFGTDGALYLTDLTNSAIKRFVDLPSNDACTVDGCPAGTYVLESIASDALMQWPDGLGFTNSGSMILFANQLQHILNDEPLSNFTMWEVPLGGRSGEVHSYMHNWAPLCVSNDPFADHSTPATDDSSCDRDAAFWGLLAWGIVATLLCIVLIVYVRMRMSQLRKDGALLEY